jgi:hypothetical protein
MTIGSQTWRDSGAPREERKRLSIENHVLCGKSHNCYRTVSPYESLAHVHVKKGSLILNRIWKHSVKLIPKDNATVSKGSVLKWRTLSIELSCQPELARYFKTEPTARQRSFPRCLYNKVGFQWGFCVSEGSMVAHKGALMQQNG